MVTDEQLNSPKPEWGNDVPDSKEGYWYRCMFDDQFPTQCASTVMRWKPTWSDQTDPSGRWVDNPPLFWNTSIANNSLRQTEPLLLMLLNTIKCCAVYIFGMINGWKHSRLDGLFLCD